MDRQVFQPMAIMYIYPSCSVSIAVISRVTELWSLPVTGVTLDQDPRLKWETVRFDTKYWGNFYSS